MSRSRRFTPIFGNSCSPSDKPFKETEHRRARRAVRIALCAGAEPPPEKAFGNPWNSPKDGRHYQFGASDRSMRK